MTWRPRTIAYGDAPSQRVEVWAPRRANRPPVALVHGGFWRLPHSRRTTWLLAIDLVRRGHPVANLGYRRVGEGGGFAETTNDVALALETAGSVDGFTGHPLTLVGHSAGATLALWLASRATGAELGGVVSLGGLLDLDDAVRRGLGGGAVDAFVSPEHRSSLSPIELPCPVPVLVVHSRDETVVPFAQAERYCERHPAQAELVAVTGSHRAMLVPRGPGWRRVRSFLDGEVHPPSS